MNYGKAILQTQDTVGPGYHRRDSLLAHKESLFRGPSVFLSNRREMQMWQIAAVLLS